LSNIEKQQEGQCRKRKEIEGVEDNVCEFGVGGKEKADQAR